VQQTFTTPIGCGAKNPVIGYVFFGEQCDAGDAQGITVELELARRGV
jgi:hypothetical protein